MRFIGSPQNLWKYSISRNITSLDWKEQKQCKTKDHRTPPNSTGRNISRLSILSAHQEPDGESQEPWSIIPMLRPHQTNPKHLLYSGSLWLSDSSVPPFSPFRAGLCTVVTWCLYTTVCWVYGERTACLFSLTGPQTERNGTQGKIPGRLTQTWG